MNCNTPNDSDTVTPGRACLVCGERDMDRLVWIDDDSVRCSTCGTQYQPGKERRDDA